MGDQEQARGPEPGDDPSPPVRESPHIMSTDKPCTAPSVPNENGDVESSYCSSMGLSMAAGKKGTYIGYILLVIGMVLSIAGQAALADDDDITGDSIMIENCPSGQEEL